ncbi:hypothetical protein FTUN_1649 [Frigoriglobus tundricola]|uniref:Uncharacterized protein n=1 Tax=Frigoriglobus tundricola TaxID=2774151 RepID=A0A6M5YLA8_9BACT|nr:hypothetical protein FTUN_1649 [Frigoriglobus tundricola]
MGVSPKPFSGSVRVPQPLNSPSPRAAHLLIFSVWIGYSFFSGFADKSRDCQPVQKTSQGRGG